MEWIIGTLFEEALGLVISLDIAFAIQEALKDAYAHDYQEQDFTMR